MCVVEQEFGELMNMVQDSDGRTVDVCGEDLRQSTIDAARGTFADSDVIYSFGKCVSKNRGT